ncbi:MAG: DUF1559 domain-containing protein [Opitutaceae bacterium]|jgi:prepilin-type N-terminal cleavage/methylation domain-containing protein/prepilin-type processing-associated H-X9-DG protein|nr:DUF1559 domain-containing protein [Opitutaceae bacterium]
MNHTFSRRARAVRADGFTLIELLTVIAIIGILAAIIIPTVGRVRESARASQCGSNQRQIAMSLLLYADDNRGYLPAANTTDVASGQTVAWTKAVRAYLPLQGASVNAREHPIFVCPSANFNGLTGTDLVRSCSATAALLWRTGPNNGLTGTIARPLATISADFRSRIPILIESKPSTATGTGSQSNLNWTTFSADTSQADAGSAVHLHLRHGERMNIAYMDASVRAASFSDLKAMNRGLYEGFSPTP